MKIITNGNREIKNLAKNLQTDLKKFEIELSHSASLNSASRILGFENYNTYKAIFIEKTTSQESQQKSILKKYKPLLFERIPYDVRRWENSYLSIEVVEKILTEYLHYNNQLVFSNIAKVFTDNKNNPYNFVLELRNCEIPKSGHWIKLDQETGVELSFIKYISIQREINSSIVEEMLEYNGDKELLEAFKAMVGVGNGEIFQSLSEEVFHFNDPNSRFYTYRNLLISRQSDVAEISKMYNLDFRPLYNSFK